MRILLVEDNEVDREVYRIMLRELGHQVVEAVHGKDGLTVAIEELPDLVLTDLSMPECDGVTEISAMRVIASLSRTPIIAMTVYPPSHWRDKAERAGCDGYLQKPITLEALAATLEPYNRAVSRLNSVG